MAIQAIKRNDTTLGDFFPPAWRALRPRDENALVPSLEEEEDVDNLPPADDLSEEAARELHKTIQRLAQEYEEELAREDFLDPAEWEEEPLEREDFSPPDNEGESYYDRMDRLGGISDESLNEPPQPAVAPPPPPIIPMRKFAGKKR